jgi:hypothetical protein
MLDSSPVNDPVGEFIKSAFLHQDRPRQNGEFKQFWIIHQQYRRVEGCRMFKRITTIANFGTAFGVTIVVFFSLAASGLPIFGLSVEEVKALAREYASWQRSYKAKVLGENFHTMKEVKWAVNSAKWLGKTRLFYLDCVTVAPERLSEEARTSLDQRLQSDFNELRNVVGQGMKHLVDGYNRPDQPSTRKIKASSQEVIDRLLRTKILLREDDRPTPFIAQPEQHGISEPRIHVPTGLIRHLCSRFYPDFMDIRPADAKSGTSFADLKDLDWRFLELDFVSFVLADSYNLQSDSIIPSNAIDELVDVISQAARLEIDFIRK